jgi:hypothetical protein
VLAVNVAAPPDAFTGTPTVQFTVRLVPGWTTANDVEPCGAADHPAGTESEVAALYTGTVASLLNVVVTFIVVPGSATDGAETVVYCGPVVRVTWKVSDSGSERDESPTRTVYVPAASVQPCAAACQ